MLFIWEPRMDEPRPASVERGIVVKPARDDHAGDAVAVVNGADWAYALQDYDVRRLPHGRILVAETDAYALAEYMVTQMGRTVTLDARYV